MFEATTLAIIACIAVTSLLFWLSALTSAEASKAWLSDTHAVTAQAPMPVSAPAGMRQLPVFNSAEVAAQFHENAHAIGLASEEVGYALDASPGQPYQRYRIRFPVKADYARIRRFVAALAADMPHLALDGVHCTRENPAAAVLVCDLNFSAFFRLDSNG